MAGGKGKDAICGLSHNLKYRSMLSVSPIGLNYSTKADSRFFVLLMENTQASSVSTARSVHVPFIPPYDTAEHAYVPARTLSTSSRCSTKYTSTAVSLFRSTMPCAFQLQMSISELFLCPFPTRRRWRVTDVPGAKSFALPRHVVVTLASGWTNNRTAAYVGCGTKVMCALPPSADEMDTRTWVSQA